MNSAIESTRFDEYCINIYRVGGDCYLVCGKRGEPKRSFTRIVFRRCRRWRHNLIRTVQQQLRILEETTDFQEWFRRVHAAPWDFESGNSGCVFCFLGCRQVAEELRGLMGPAYGQFLATTLEIAVDDLRPEPAGDPAGSPAPIAGTSDGPHLPPSLHSRD